jgi:hypothetical protein
MQKQAYDELKQTIDTQNHASMMDVMFTLQQIIGKGREFYLPMYILRIDYEAYDSLKSGNAKTHFHITKYTNTFKKKRQCKSMSTTQSPCQNYKNNYQLQNRTNFKICKCQKQLSGLSPT